MEPLPEGTRIVARWGFGAETRDSWVVGEVLVRSDGVLLRRYGGVQLEDRDATGKRQVSYSFRPWHVVDWWTGHTEVDAAMRSLKGRGWSLWDHGPASVHEQRSGPFDDPGPVTYL
jgi:hypothetical protein